MILAFRRYAEANRRLLTVLAAVAAGNILFVVLLTTPTLYKERELIRRLEGSESKLCDAFREFGLQITETEILASTRGQIQDLWDGTFQSKAARFPTVDAKINELMSDFKLSSLAKQYAYVELIDGRLEQLLVSFRLKGSYADLRKFISQLERAHDAGGHDLFFAIERVNLIDSTLVGRELNLDIGVATFFYDPEVGRSAGRSGGAADRAGPSRGRRSRGQR